MGGKVTIGMQSNNSSHKNNMSTIMDRILDHRILPDKEVRELVRRAQLGNEDAKKKVIEHNMLLIAKWARKYSHMASFDDLVQEGVLGLVRAIEKFDPDKGTRFSTYASWWIKCAMLEFVKSEKYEKYDRRRGHHIEKPVSIDAQINGSEDIKLADVVAVESPDYLADIADRERQKKLAKGMKELAVKLNELPSPTKEILSLYLGINGELLPPKKIAERLKVDLLTVYACIRRWPGILSRFYQPEHGIS
jgi:RNA polymerase sigma factor (sigma-70 family)